MDWNTFTLLLLPFHILLVTAEEGCSGFVPLQGCHECINRDDTTCFMYPDSNEKSLDPCNRKCYPPNGELPDNPTKIQAVTCMGTQPPIYVCMPGYANISMGVCQCDNKLIDAFETEILKGLPAMFELGCRLFFGFFSEILDIGLLAIPGVGEMSEAMVVSARAARTIKEATDSAKDQASSFSSWMDPCGPSTHLTDSSNKLVDTLSGVGLKGYPTKKNPNPKGKDPPKNPPKDPPKNQKPNKPKPNTGDDDKPDKPEDHGKPKSKPDDDDKPDGHDKPGKPHSHDKPDKSDPSKPKTKKCKPKPKNPDKPGNPNKPDPPQPKPKKCKSKSKNADKPGKPDKPDAPGNPDKPDPPQPKPKKCKSKSKNAGKPGKPDKPDAPKPTPKKCKYKPENPNKPAPHKPNKSGPSVPNSKSKCKPTATAGPKSDPKKPGSRRSGPP